MGIGSVGHHGLVRWARITNDTNRGVDYRYSRLNRIGLLNLDSKGESVIDNRIPVPESPWAILIRQSEGQWSRQTEAITGG